MLQVVKVTHNDKLMFQSVPMSRLACEQFAKIVEGRVRLHTVEIIPYDQVELPDKSEDKNALKGKSFEEKCRLLPAICRKYGVTLLSFGEKAFNDVNKTECVKACPIHGRYTQTFGSMVSRGNFGCPKCAQEHHSTNSLRKE